MESRKRYLITLYSLEACIRLLILTPCVYMTLLQLVWNTTEENMCQSLCQPETFVLDRFVKCKLKETYCIVFNIDLVLYLETF